MIDRVDPWYLAVGIAGALITVGSTMIAGFRLQQWALRLGVTWLPADVGAIGGLAIGIFIVARWLGS